MPMSVASTSFRFGVSAYSWGSAIGYSQTRLRDLFVSEETSRTIFYANFKWANPPSKQPGRHMVLEKGPCNSRSRNFVLEISNLKRPAESADLQQSIDLKAFVEVDPSQTDASLWKV